MRIPAAYLHLIMAVAAALAAAMMSTVPGRSKWIVVVLATVLGMINAGMAVAALV